MAERKATNKYYPPDWDPSKGSLNKHLGQHPLRARARKLSEGILIVRFEMPFNIWCLGCNQHIGRGVRFNAEKKAVDKFYSTTIWSFRMKCHLCSNWFEIRTDPKHSDYVVHEGARRKCEERTADELQIKASLGPEERVMMQENPFFRLEHQVRDETTAKVAVPKLASIQETNARTWGDDYNSSRQVRKRFREEKRRLLEESATSLKTRVGDHLTLVPERAEDVMLARNMVASTVIKGHNVGEAAKRIRHESIFGGRSRRTLSFVDDEPQEGNLIDKLDFKKLPR